MPSSTMRTAVLQATTLYLLCLILDHHMSESIFDPIMNNEGWLNMLDAMNKSAHDFATQPVPERLMLDAGNTTNTSSRLNHTAGLNNPETSNVTLGATREAAESFYSRSLPRDAVVCVVICALQYWWLIWLERMFPARPRYKAVPSLREEKVEESEDREEEVVQKWIAQGRIRRASLNWCNTFLKWVLEMTVGRVMCFTANHVLTALLKFQSPRTVYKGLGEVCRSSAAPLIATLTRNQAYRCGPLRRVHISGTLYYTCFFRRRASAQANCLLSWCRCGHNHFL